MTEVNDLDPIPAEQARQILHHAISARLGSDWDDELEGWTVISQHDYMARLTKGRRTIDFLVDLVGEVTIEEKEIGGSQEASRTLAFMVLGASVLLAIILARIAGYL